MGSKPRANPVDRVALEAYERLLATAGVERRGKTMPYTSLNGHMFSFLDKTGAVSLRLPEPARSAFLERFETRLSVQYNTVMKEYAVVPAALLEDTATLAPHFAESLAYARSLKPKG